jgi:CRP-like cAMP-binding protein
MALIDDVPRSADAIVNQDTTLLGIERGDFESLLFLNKDLAYSVLWAFSRTLSQRLREMNNKIQALLAMRGGF